MCGQLYLEFQTADVVSSALAGAQIYIGESRTSAQAHLDPHPLVAQPTWICFDSKALHRAAHLLSRWNCEVEAIVPR